MLRFFYYNTFFIENNFAFFFKSQPSTLSLLYSGIFERHFFAPFAAESDISFGTIRTCLYIQIVVNHRVCIIGLTHRDRGK